MSHLLTLGNVVIDKAFIIGRILSQFDREVYVTKKGWLFDSQVKTGVEPHYQLSVLIQGSYACLDTLDKAERDAWTVQVDEVLAARGQVL